MAWGGGIWFEEIRGHHRKAVGMIKGQGEVGNSGETFLRRGGGWGPGHKGLR